MHRPALETGLTALRGQCRIVIAGPLYDAGMPFAAIRELNSTYAATAQNLHNAQD